MLLISAIYSDYVRCKRLVPLISVGKRCVWRQRCVTFIIHLLTSLFQCLQLMVQLCSYCVINKRHAEINLPHLNIAWILCFNFTIHLTTSTSNLLSVCITHQETNQVILHHSSCSKKIFQAFTNCVCVIKMCSITFCCLYGWCVKTKLSLY